jgi:hypothetical protein
MTIETPALVEDEALTLMKPDICVGRLLSQARLPLRYLPSSWSHLASPSVSA